MKFRSADMMGVLNVSLNHDDAQNARDAICVVVDDMYNPPTCAITTLSISQARELSDELITLIHQFHEEAT